MANFIEVTDNDGKKHFLNTLVIAEVSDKNGKAVLRFIQGRVAALILEVKESYNDIKTALLP